MKKEVMILLVSAVVILAAGVVFAETITQTQFVDCDGSDAADSKTFSTSPGEACIGFGDDMPISCNPCKFEISLNSKTSQTTLDLVFLVDSSNSFQDEWDTLTAKKEDIVDTIESSGKFETVDSKIYALPCRARPSNGNKCRSEGADCERGQAAGCVSDISYENDEVDWDTQEILNYNPKQGDAASEGWGPGAIDVILNKGVDGDGWNEDSKKVLVILADHDPTGGVCGIKGECNQDSSTTWRKKGGAEEAIAEKLKEVAFANGVTVLFLYGNMEYTTTNMYRDDSENDAIELMRLVASGANSEVCTQNNKCVKNYEDSNKIPNLINQMVSEVVGKAELTIGGERREEEILAANTEITLGILDIVMYFSGITAQYYYPIEVAFEGMDSITLQNLNIVYETTPEITTRFRCYEKDGNSYWQLCTKQGTNSENCQGELDDSSDNCYISDNSPQSCCPTDEECVYNSGLDEYVCSYDVIYCSDYGTESACEDYDDDVAEKTVEDAEDNENLCGYVGDEYSGDEQNEICHDEITCSCSWEEGQCKGVSTSEDICTIEGEQSSRTVKGKCVYSMEKAPTDNCATTGEKTINWIAQWYDADGTLVDPTPDDVICNGGEKTYPCIDTTKLGFFSWWGVIAVILLIAGIYYFIEKGK